MNNDSMLMKNKRFSLTSPVLREPENYEEMLKKLHLRETERVEALQNKYSATSYEDLIKKFRDKQSPAFSVPSFSPSEIIREPSSSFVRKLHQRILKDFF